MSLISYFSQSLSSIPNNKINQKDPIQAHCYSFSLLFLKLQSSYVRDCQGLCADFIYPLIKMKFTHTILLLSAVAFLTLGQIAPSTTSSSSSPPAPSAPTFTTTPIDLRFLNDTAIETELYASLQTINESKNFQDTVPILAAALLVTASTGDKTYYLYVDVIDAEGKLREFEGVVVVAAVNIDNITSYNYTLISVTEKAVGQVLESNATSLPSFLDEVASGYTKYTDAQIASDSYLLTVGINISAANPLVFSTKPIAVYTKLVALATAYVIFYQGTITESVSLWKAVALNDKVSTFIESFERVVVPTTIQK